MNNTQPFWRNHTYAIDIKRFQTELTSWKLLNIIWTFICDPGTSVNRTLQREHQREHARSCVLSICPLTTHHRLYQRATFSYRNTWRFNIWWRSLNQDALWNAKPVKLWMTLIEYWSYSYELPGVSECPNSTQKAISWTCTVRLIRHSTHCFDCYTQRQSFTVKVEVEIFYVEV